MEFMSNDSKFHELNYILFIGFMFKLSDPSTTMEYRVWTTKKNAQLNVADDVHVH